ncbi:MAG TPA: hypothetical protein VK654_01310, partial [Nitrospirota bacterium]|nr:hypothetical protein [Nitrospirota bacterium]
LWHELAKKIKEFLTADQHRCCILEYSLAEAIDPWIENAKSNIVTHDKEVYHFLSQEETTKQIIHALGEAESISPPAVGALISTNNETKKVQAVFRDGQKKGLISLNQLQVLAENAAFIFVEAYDGDGYVMWQKRKSSNRVHSDAPKSARQRRVGNNDQNG